VPLQDIETIVFVMLENRSFDHLLGYLSMSADTTLIPVEGLRADAAWLASLANQAGGKAYPPVRLTPDTQQIADPPHDHATIAVQVDTARPAVPGSGMGGFVASYLTRNPPPQDPSAVMGYYDAAAVPTYDFFARQFVACDHWFAAVPCGTQPNRLMAMGGHSSILDNAAVFLPDQDLAYDWLTRQGVSWCAYQSGDFLPFFTLMPGWLPEITTSLALSALGGKGRFRRYEQFRAHWLGAEAMPSVIFIEPEYTDGPHGSPNDDHPPTGVAKGQAFVADIYATLIANPARWAATLMVVTYDEHGGFFDHVPPLPIPSNPGGTAVSTTGVRVPAFLVSPLVSPGIPFTDALDHTSFLQLLADRFTPGQDYSPEVAQRQAQLGRIATALTRVPSPGEAAPALGADAVSSIAGVVARTPGSAGTADSPGATATTVAFRGVAAKISADHADLLAGPGWERLANYVTTSPTLSPPPATEIV
jgi:phospholipase C